MTVYLQAWELTAICRMTQREPEAKETWRAMNQDSAKEFRERVAVTGWGYGAGDIVKSTESITKVKMKPAHL